MEKNSKKMIEELIDINALEKIGKEYGEHIEYLENMNKLIYSGRTISVLLATVLAIILLINKIRKKKVNKKLLIFFIIFIIMTIVMFFIKVKPV